MSEPTKDDFEVIGISTCREDLYKVGVIFSLDRWKDVYEITELLPRNRVTLYNLNRGEIVDYPWTVPLTTSYLLMQRVASTPYDPVIRKIKSMEAKRKSLGYRW